MSDLMGRHLQDGWLTRSGRMNCFAALLSAVKSVKKSVENIRSVAAATGEETTKEGRKQARRFCGEA